MNGKKGILVVIAGLVVVAGCLSVVEPIQREYHVDTVIQPGEIYTKKVQVDDPSERVVPTICYNITTNGSAGIYVFNNTTALEEYRHTLQNTENLSDLRDKEYPHQTGRLSDAWQPTYHSETEDHEDTYIHGGLEPGTYYFTVENTEFRRHSIGHPVDGPLAVQLDLYVANKECPFTYPGPP